MTHRDPNADARRLPNGDWSWMARGPGDAYAHGVIYREGRTMEEREREAWRLANDTARELRGEPRG